MNIIDGFSVGSVIVSPIAGEGYSFAVELLNKSDVDLAFRPIDCGASIGTLREIAGGSFAATIVPAHGKFVHSIGTVPAAIVKHRSFDGFVGIRIIFGRPGLLEHKLERPIPYTATTGEDGRVVVLRLLSIEGFDDDW